MQSAGSIRTSRIASPTLNFRHKSASRHSQYMDWTSAWMVWGSNPGGDNRFFSSPKRPNRLLDPPSLLFNGYHGSSPGVKHAVSQFNHSPPFSVEVKSEWSYTATPLIRLRAADNYNNVFFFNFEGYKIRTKYLANCRARLVTSSVLRRGNLVIW